MLQRPQPFVRFFSLQDWQNRESFLQRLWTLVPGHLSSHSAMSSYGLFAPLTFWRLSVYLRFLVQTLESCPASGALWSPTIPPYLGMSQVTNNNSIWLLFKKCITILTLFTNGAPKIPNAKQLQFFDVKTRCPVNFQRKNLSFCENILMQSDHHQSVNKLIQFLSF